MQTYCCFFLINIFIISYFLSFCQTENIDDEYENYKCLMITLYNDGSIMENFLEEPEGNMHGPMTITSEDKIIIYQCKKEEVECIYDSKRIVNNNSSLCFNQNTTNKDYSCCYIKKKSI